MMYYYYLLRYNLSNKIHIYHRNKFDRSWKQNILERKRFKIASSNISVVDKISLLTKVK